MESSKKFSLKEIEGALRINQILFNISFIAAFYGTGYSVMSRPISVLGNTKKVKKCLKLELINLVLNIFLVAMNFIAEVKHQGIAQIGVIWQYFWTQIAFNVLLILLAALFFTYLFVRTKQNIYSGVEIDSKYIDFTKAVGTNREVFIIAGDFGFLGRVPKKTVKNFDQCAAALKKLLETNRPECSGDSNSDQCKNCIFKKEQFKQLVDKVKNKSVKLKILCRRPHADEEEYKITIGYFMELFPRMEIKFYTNPDGKCPDLPLRGRIIETAQNSKKMFSHYIDYSYDKYDNFSAEKKSYCVYTFSYGDLYHETRNYNVGHVALLRNCFPSDQIEIYDPGPRAAGIKIVSRFAMHDAMEAIRGGVYIFEKC